MVSMGDLEAGLRMAQAASKGAKTFGEAQLVELYEKLKQGAYRCDKAPSFEDLVVALALLRGLSGFVREEG